MDTEPIVFGLTALTPLRLVVIAVASAAASALFGAYERSVRNRF